MSSCPECGKALVPTKFEGVEGVRCFCGYQSDEALDWLRNPALLGYLEDAITTPGSDNPLIGESDNGLQFVLIILAKRSVEVRGLTASGKNTLVDHVLAIFPSDWWKKVGGITDHSLRYIPDDLKILYITERRGFMSGRPGEETTAEYDIKLGISEGEITVLVPERQEKTGRQESKFRKVVVESFIMTTTEVAAPPELENRIDVLYVRDDITQNQLVRDSQLEGAKTFSWEKRDYSHERAIAKKVIRYVQEQAPREVKIPYVDALKPILSVESSSVRRHTPRILDKIKSCARLHYLQRERTPDGRGLVASPDDLALVLYTGLRPLAALLSALPEKPRLVLDICKGFAASLEITTESVWLNAGDRRAELSKSTIRKSLHELYERGILTFAGKKGKANIYNLESDFESPLALDVPRILTQANGLSDPRVLTPEEADRWRLDPHWTRSGRVQSEQDITSTHAQRVQLTSSAFMLANSGSDGSRPDLQGDAHD